MMASDGKKPGLLFLCTGNSCRSQMGEGFARKKLGDAVDVYSAGVIAKGVNPFAAKVMAEKGIDLSTHKSQVVGEFLDKNVTVVLTVCGHAHETCPAFPKEAKIIHHAFDDPPHLAEGLSEEEALPIYRRVRDEIQEYVDTVVPTFFEKQ
ncbi:hypothetical protein BSKO_09275 [Bryopsis sp. KO-2023]|nr:hypothetical protein BSKO_09275 [Bryopsis sp. KO-2023]